MLNNISEANIKINYLEKIPYHKKRIMKFSKTLKLFFSILPMLMVFNLFGQNGQDMAPPVSPDEIFREVEQMPRFPGCENLEASEDEIRNCVNKKVIEYFHSNVEYPEAAKINKVEGTAIVQFLVNASGKVRNGSVVRDIKGHFTAPILAMFETMPDWTPGRQEGKAVNVMYTFPVMFRLPNENTALNEEVNNLGMSPNTTTEKIVKEFASDFEMTMEDGSKKKLSDFQGQIVYLSFWASWCGPCIKGFNKYRAIREDIEKLGVVMLNVSVDKDAEKWKTAIAQHQPTGIHALIPHHEVIEPYQLYKLPGYEIIGKNGQFLYLSEEADRDILENFRGFLSRE